MRKKKSEVVSDYKILVLDDEIGIVESLSVLLNRSGYHSTCFTDPMKAIERLQGEHYDMLILDYLMQPIHGDEVVKRVREFNKDIYILLLTGYKDLAPPMETIKALDIQGYCEKSNKFDQLLLLIESGIKSISQRETIKKYSDGLNRILDIVPSIYRLQPIENILDGILAQVKPLVGAKDAFVLIDDITRYNDNSGIFRGIGRYSTDITSFMKMLGPRLMGQIGHARASLEVICDGQEIILPLTFQHSNSMGVIYVEGACTGLGIKLLEIYSHQVSAALNNAFLHSVVNTKNEELIKTYEELKIRYLETIEALRLAIDAKDGYTRGHSDRVAYYAVKIGERFGLSPEQLETLRVAGVFHDVGKIATSDDILYKRGSLNEMEYNEIKKHPVKGADILSVVSMFKEIVPLVKCHHERVDGRGYSMGLKGNEIPFLARILSVADAFDAMTSDRLYKPKLNIEEAKKQLIEGAGSQFDSSVVNEFLNLLKDYKYMRVELERTYNEAFQAYELSHRGRQ